MKTAHDPRHQIRRDTVKDLFAESFTVQKNSQNLTKVVHAKREEIDSAISQAATEWPIDKLNKMDLAILRLSVYELLHTDTPPRVIIDEAVELAKEYGSETSPSFVNGVLGTIYKQKSQIND